MDEEQLLQGTIDEIFNAFGGGPTFKILVSSYITKECHKNKERVESCIRKVHRMIHQYEYEKEATKREFRG